jgi:hypothetical protein
VEGGDESGHKVLLKSEKSVVIQLKLHMITTTTRVTDSDRSNKPWFLLHKCIDRNFNFFVLFFEFY